MALFKIDGYVTTTTFDLTYSGVGEDIEYLLWLVISDCLDVLGIVLSMKMHQSSMMLFITEIQY